MAQMMITLLAVVLVQCTTAQDEGALRLVDGTADTNGRLEIFLDSQWLRICGYDFDYKAAEVVCRQMGMDTGIARPIPAHTPGRYNGGIDEVRCMGDEATLLDCYYDRSDYCSSHYGFVGVDCDALDRSDVELRWQPGSVDTGRGRPVEMLYEGQWQPFCANTDGFSTGSALCRGLGMTKGTMWHGGEDNPVPSIYIRCNGRETKASQCYITDTDFQCNSTDHAVRLQCNRLSHSCRAGTYGRGVTRCTLCPIGQYQYRHSVADGCDNCPVGLTTAEEGTVFPTDCVDPASLEEEEEHPEVTRIKGEILEIAEPAKNSLTGFLQCVDQLEAVAESTRTLWLEIKGLRDQADANGETDLAERLQELMDDENALRKKINTFRGTAENQRESKSQVLQEIEDLLAGY